MSKIKPPKSVKILGRTVKIKLQDMGENLGEFHLDKSTIYLDRGLNEADMKACLLHECLHGILAMSGHSFGMSDEQEEALVRALEHGLDPLVWFK